MPFGEIGACLLFLVALLVLGSLWFHFVEGVLRRIKTLFSRRRAPSAWHTLPPDEEDEKDA